jgi:DNA-binding transcriptional MerR regulator
MVQEMYMAKYSIRDLEKLSGIKAHTLRIWEKRHKLLEPKRTNTNIRYYNDADLKKILNIALLNRNGYKISKIAGFRESEMCEQVNELAKTSPEITSIIDGLVISMIEMDENRFGQIFSANIDKYGFEETILNIIYPFFEKVGMLWQTGSINPAQEHFISNLIRQKISTAIESTSLINNSRSKSFLIFLPEGELHEIGLLFYYFLAKKQGHRVIYLGQSIPYDDIESVQKIRTCDYILTSFSSAINGLDINNYLSKLAGEFKDKTILFSSFEYEGIKKHLPVNVIRIMNAVHFAEFLKSI